MILFEDLNNTYKLLDYHITHSRLLLRSMRSKDREYNIDIVFKPVDKLILNTSFNGLEISLCKVDDFAWLISDYQFDVRYNNKIFCLKDNADQQYYINAMAMGVFHNQLESNESSIKGMDDEFGEKLLWYN